MTPVPETVERVWLCGIYRAAKEKAAERRDRQGSAAPRKDGRAVREEVSR